VQVNSLKMKVDYQKIVDYVVESGKRLVTKTGRIADIGITKEDLTEEDIRIERGLKEILDSFGDSHTLYAEEENDVFQNSESLWVADPISGTGTFIKGLPHYSIVVSHLSNHKVVFAVVYDPSVDELFTAKIGEGTLLNGKRIRVSEGNSNVILRVTKVKIDIEKELISEITRILSKYNVTTKSHSMAVDYCAVACGRYDGIVSVTKDSFPEFAGSLIIREAGGRFANLSGEPNFLETDRAFVAGNEIIFKELQKLIQDKVK